MSDRGFLDEDRSIKIEKDAISSAIISGDGNKVVIYQYQLERQVEPQKTSQTEKIGPNPYKGLLAFQEEDGDRYFGREKQIEKLWNIFRSLHENTTQPETPLRLLPILGPSGSGKSSLARAGLIPELARRPLPGKSQARVAVLVPGTHPVEALATVLARIATNDQTPVAKTREFAEELKKINHTNIYDGLRRIADVLPEIAISPLVVLVDQFEEIYSLCNDASERSIFIQNLVHASADRSARVSVIITLRSDFLGETQKHLVLNQLIAQQGVIIPAMTAEELRQAIGKPAELAHHPLDEATVKLLVEQTQGREGALPLLQFALTQIWQGLTQGIEPAVTLEQIGGVGGALAGEAQRIFDNLSVEEKEIARRVFLGLVQLGEGARDTRRRALLAGLISYKDDPERVKQVIDKFASRDVRLITVSSSAKGDETAEVTHEALFDYWQQLNKWLDGSRSDIRFQRRLEEAAIAWNENGRPEGSLWRSPDLDLLRRYHQRAANEMTPLQLDFFNAAVDAKEADVKAKEKQKRLLKTLAIGFGGGFMLTTTTTGFAAWQWQQARIAEINALKSSAEALLTSNQNFDALIDSIKAGIRIKGTFTVNADNRIPLLELLQQTVNLVKEKNRLEGHTGSVNSVAFSPDGNTIASASYQNVKLWSQDGRVMQTLKHDDWVNSVAFSPDGNTIASASYQSVKLWSRDGRVLQILKHDDWVNSVVFSPDGNTIASASNKIAKLWSRDGRVLQILKHDDWVKSVAFSPDGNTIATASGDKTVKLWSRNGQEPKTLRGHEDWVTSVAFSPDSKLIATASKDKTVKLWSRDGKELQTLTGHQNAVNSITFNPKGNVIATASEDNSVKLWKLDNHDINYIKPLSGHTAGVNSLAFSPDGNIIATASKNIVKLWSRDGKELKPLIGHPDVVKSVAFSPDGNIIATASKNIVKLWSRDGRVLQNSIRHNNNDWVNSVAFSPDSKTIATASNQTVKLWDTTTGKEQKNLIGHHNIVNSIAFDPDGKTIATASNDTTVKLWDTTTGKELKTLAGHQDIVTSVAFSPDGKTIATASHQAVKLWSTTTGKELKSISGYKNSFNSVAFSPNGKLIATAGNDKTVKLWSLKGKIVRTFRGHQDVVNSVTFSPDGNTIASASGDKIVILWNSHLEDLDQLLVRACNWAQDYLKTNPNVSPENRQLCDGIRNQ
jgi:WD40 repeat protein